MRRYVVRRVDMSIKLYMQMDGAWGPYKSARRFASRKAADIFARGHGSTYHGIV